MNDLLYSVILYPIIYIFPAYVANGAPVIFGGGRAIDFNRKLRGKPILGKNKTIRGFVTGLISGVIIGYLESLALPYMLLVGILLSLGALVGDLLGSFIKRRLGSREGSEIFLLDEYPFLVVALLFAFPLGHTPDVYGILFLLILTIAMHRLTNGISKRLNLKHLLK